MAAKFLRVGLVILTCSFSKQTFACLDMPIVFAADGSSFAGEEFQLRKTSHGPVLYNDGTEAYFNPVKRQWCMSPAGIAKEQKEKEKCISSSANTNANSKGTSLQDSSGKVIGVFKISLRGCLLLQSVRADGSADLSKTYLEVCDQSHYEGASGAASNESPSKPYQGRMEAKINGDEKQGYAEINGPNGNVDSTGWVSFPRFRSLSASGDQTPSYDGFKAEGKKSLNGRSMIKTAGCGLPRVESAGSGGSSGSSSGVTGGGAN